MKNTDATRSLFDLNQLGEFGDVNPSISDSATFTFQHADDMAKTFTGEVEGYFLYSRHWNPTNKCLADALATLEGAEAGWVTSSGMGAITSTILHLCNTGDHIVASRTIYGGSFAFMNNYLKKFNIETTFVDITNLDSVKKAIKPNTKLIYTESMTNPLLQISNIPELSKIAKSNGIKLVVDNTFTPLIIRPLSLGADIVVYSMTKFINGKNDCVGGAICGKLDFINSMIDVNSGSAMLLGPVLDPMRSSSIHKNLHTLHIRMQKHSENAMYLAKKMEEKGLKVCYPGLSNHSDHELFKSIMVPDFGFGGMVTLDMGTSERASKLMEAMELANVGYLAVSLGYFKTLFSNSGKSTSSEVPEDVQNAMGLSEGLVRFSVGLDHNIETTWQRIEKCIDNL
ncbi:MAG: aminotransferase class I/II-fold pyridoxal phosphate-dependent enzyme [Bacteroidales bacterium]